MRPILKRIIAPTQATFVIGRWIHENGLLAQELIATAKKKKGREGLIGIKLDMAKIYDRIEWPFLLKVLQLFRFPEQYIQWIE